MPVLLWSSEVQVLAAKLFSDMGADRFRALDTDAETGNASDLEDHFSRSSGRTTVVYSGNKVFDVLANLWHLTSLILITVAMHSFETRIPAC